MAMAMSIYRTLCVLVIEHVLTLSRKSLAVKKFGSRKKRTRICFGSKIKFRLDFKFKLGFWGRWQEWGGGSVWIWRNCAAGAAFKKLPLGQTVITHRIIIESNTTWNLLFVLLNNLPSWIVPITLLSIFSSAFAPAKPRRGWNLKLQQPERDILIPDPVF